MGELEIDTGNGKLIFHANIITYGNAADPVVTERIRSEIEWMWNEPKAVVMISNMMLDLEFRISADLVTVLDPYTVVSNLDPKNNYFRIEERSFHNISFVDGLGCNTGYFQYDNLYEGSTTEAGLPGGTMHPRFRKVRMEDIRSLKLHRLKFSGGRAMLGEFTNVYHSAHD
jgi:hypothetical protein